MYFIALVAPKKINDDVLKWKQFMKERYDCSVALRSPAHITLIPPFRTGDDAEEKLETAILDFSLRCIPFEIKLKNFGAFRPTVIHVEVLVNETLNELHSQLEEFLISKNLVTLTKDDRPYHPHVTIATRDLHKKAFHKAWEIFKARKYEASWITGGISLLRHNQKNWDVIFTSRFKMV